MIGYTKRKGTEDLGIGFGGKCKTSKSNADEFSITTELLHIIVTKDIRKMDSGRIFIEDQSSHLIRYQ